ncbi:MAG: hypothetical protein IMF06_12925, partial [Proteobacteria bacterium]|nr:hypothetical protein [Pseudomonadota bacterium]
QNGEIDFDQKRLETIQRGALSRGGFLLEQYISAIDERFAGITIEQRARAVLELADWYQWNGSKRRASEQYEAVVKILTEGGQGGLMQAWFGQPVELPDNGVFWQPPLPGPETEPSVVTATYDVTSQGSVKKLSVDVEGEAPVYRFKRELKNTRFRPRYDTDGESVYVEKLSREYELYD